MRFLRGLFAKTHVSLPGVALACPCCGFLTILEPYDICPICFWEYDDLGWVYAGEPVGPNSVSLLDGQRNFVRTGSAKLHTLPHVRPPWPADIKDPLWRPLNPARDTILTMDDEPGEIEPPHEPYWLLRR